MRRFRAARLIGWTGFLVFTLDVLVEPGAGVSPPAVSGGARDAQAAAGFLDGQPREETQLDQFCLRGVLLGEQVECFVERFQVVGAGGSFGFLQLPTVAVAAAFAALLAAGVLN